MSRFHTVSTNSALLSPFPRHFRSPSLLSRRLPLFSRALWIVCLRWHLRFVLDVVAAVVVDVTAAVDVDAVVVVEWI